MSTAIPTRVVPEVIYVVAPNDSDGNPRRGWLITYPNGLSEWVKEGYAGNDPLFLALGGGNYDHGKQVADWAVGRRVEVYARDWEAWNIGAILSAPAVSKWFLS